MLCIHVIYAAQTIIRRSASIVAIDEWHERTE